MVSSIKSFLDTLPQQPGIYIYKDEIGKIIYVGASSNLKKRVSSYFRKDFLDSKTYKLVSKIKTIDYEIHKSEEAAFLRERELIRVHKPRFNLDWKDDKEYPLICITVPSETERFSRLFIVRSILNQNDWFFGRKTDVKALRASIRSIRKNFPIANKSYCFKTRKPCLDYSIKRCTAPCSGKISLEEYQKIVDQLVLFLKGKRQDLIDQLYIDMRKASDDMNYELAAKIRDRIEEIEVTIDTQKGLVRSRDRDVLILIEDSNYYLLLILWIENETVINSEVKFLGYLEALPETEIIKSFIKNYYLRMDFIPLLIEISYEMNEEIETLEILLSKRHGRSVHLITNREIESNSQIKLFTQKHRLELGETIRSLKKEKELHQQALEELKQYLGMKSIPHRIEAFDISNIQGALPVGSMIVFQDGFPKKTEYRRFMIKNIKEEPNDIAMLQEVITRRLNHNDNLFAARQPDLFVIDGGKPQVNAVFRIFQKKGVNIPVIGLAKKEEKVFFPKQKDHLPIPLESAALRLLRQTRDEAHRFAISYHKKRRLNQSRSILNQIPGIGMKRRNALLEHFGDLEEIKKASVDELCQVKNINRQIAERIRLFFTANN